NGGARYRAACAFRSGRKQKLLFSRELCLRLDSWFAKSCFRASRHCLMSFYEAMLERMRSFDSISVVGWRNIAIERSKKMRRHGSLILLMAAPFWGLFCVWCAL